MEHKIDFTKVPLSVLYKFFTSKMEFSDMIEMLEQVTVGGVMDLPFTELPSIMSTFVAEYQKNSETIAIAIGSMRNYIDGEDSL
jgi:cytochrome c oxidase assembly factor CtaG